jgi:hypothetical protein
MKKNQIIRNKTTGETLTMLVSDEETAAHANSMKFICRRTARVRRFITMWTFCSVTRRRCPASSNS